MKSAVVHDFWDTEAFINSIMALSDNQELFNSTVIACQEELAQSDWEISASKIAQVLQQV